MSRLIIALVASLGGFAGLAATSAPAQAQAVVAGGDDIFIGDRVHVYAGDGVWYAAIVRDVGGDDVLVHYTGTSRYRDEWVDLSRVSLRGATVGVAYQPAIQVYFGTRWYDGALLARRGNLFQVRYAGRVEWVGPDRWHHRGHAHRAHWQRGHVAPNRHAPVRHAPRRDVRRPAERHERPRGHRGR